MCESGADASALVCLCKNFGRRRLMRSRRDIGVACGGGGGGAPVASRLVHAGRVVARRIGRSSMLGLVARRQFLSVPFLAIMTGWWGKMSWPCWNDVLRSQSCCPSFPTIYPCLSLPHLQHHVLPIKAPYAMSRDGKDHVLRGLIRHCVHLANLQILPTPSICRDE
jgi:hypothetical protein